MIMKNIYLLPTDQQSRIHKNDKGELVLCDLYFGKNTINGHHLYITYNEYIERGDKGWLLEDSSNVVNVTEFDCTNGLGGIYPTDRKIVLTTDPILIKDGVQEVDEDFLKTYVKNPIDEIVVQTFVRKCGVETDANGYRLMDKHEYYYKLKSI